MVDTQSLAEDTHTEPPWLVVQNNEMGEEKKNKKKKLRKLYFNVEQFEWPLLIERFICEPKYGLEKLSELSFGGKIATFHKKLE